MTDLTPVEHTTEIGEAISRVDSFNAIFWIVMAVNLLIFAVIKTRQPGHINSLFGAILQNKQFLMNSREEQGRRGLATPLLCFTYFNCFGIIVWMFAGRPNDYFILILTLGLIILSSLKLVVIRLLSITLNAREGLQDHYVNHLLFFQVGGILLTPILFFIYYIPVEYRMISILCTFIFLSFLIVFRETLSFVRSIQWNISIFYIILYLCTLEILPLMVGYRIISLETEAF